MARRIRGSHIFPYKFPFAFDASFTGRDIQVSEGGFEPIAIPVMGSDELPILVCDGMVLSSGYLYLVGRMASGVHYIWKVNASDYSDYIYADPDWFGGGDGIVVAGGYLWVGDLSGIGVYKLSLSDLSTVTSYDCFGLGITALATDGTYIYAGTDSGGYLYKIKISDGTTTHSSSSIGGSYYIHSLIYDSGYVYGIACITNGDSKAFKFDTSDLSLDATLTTTDYSHHDDILQDDTYFYAPRTLGGISRFRKSDLDYTLLEFTDGLPSDGLALVDGKLLLGWGQHHIEDGAPVNTQRIWVANQATFDEYNRITIYSKYRQINEILVDGNFIHVLQYKGTASKGIWLYKFRKADILTNLIYSDETGRTIKDETGRRIAGGNTFPYTFPFRFQTTLTGQRMAGDNTFPYRFPFRFNASITGRTINSTS